ncbi:ABC transporter permease subunit [Adhaeretor mobilis]|uniref:ABC-2 family transporter protein n=1 Tax=Adhaeretor mobilis TaxID=1930276 RepID=A0A517N029_9BACT|nr:ABC transporter permease subunit [Adhaeretor mobilis]QDT00490.1 ABC-2 family transporter protein [Adhaeretor mobilis]
MLVGPVFSREVTTTPRNWRLYGLRALYVGALFSLAITAWLILSGSQPVRGIGDLSRFGGTVFALIAPVQMALGLAFSALLTAAAVAMEKDRRTLDLLLMTNMTNSELVLGRLLASVLSVLMLILASLPLLMLLTLLGGVSAAQVLRVTAVTLVAALAGGSLGSMLALWREKTFQTLAMTALVLGLWLLLGEAIASGVFGPDWWGVATDRWAAGLSPLRAVFAAVEPLHLGNQDRQLPYVCSEVNLFLIFGGLLMLALNATAIAMVRVWNPSQEARPRSETRAQSEKSTDQALAAGVDIHADSAKTREVWDNPILWREICTWAYGKKIILVRVAYLIVFAICAAGLWSALQAESYTSSGPFPSEARPLAPLMVLGLLLVNALAVTSITNERDLRALDLLLVTDLSPKEIILGKLVGVFYNAKEMILLPALLCGVLWYTGRLGTENLVFLLLGLLTLTSFTAMLGVHLGMSYPNSRTAVAASLGTVLFLLLGIAVCMRMMLAFQTSFGSQFLAFTAFMFGGGVGLYTTLAYRNESKALAIACLTSPFATFFIMTSFLQANFGAAMMVTLLTYGFATAAMLIPAIDEFDIATGRATAQD